MTLPADGGEYPIAPEDVLISTQQSADWVSADDRGVQIALSTALTPELKREGMARDFVRQVQQLRKDAGLEIEQRIRVQYSTDDAEILGAIAKWHDYICTETLADSLVRAASSIDTLKTVLVGETQIQISITS